VIQSALGIDKTDTTTVPFISSQLQVKGDADEKEDNGTRKEKIG
jgi:hypothetical protein